MGKFQSCSCCPYGYHIDLDFVRFCEALSLNSGNRPDQDGDAASRQRRRERRQRRERRLQRQSMEVLLGLAPLPVPEVKNEYLSSMKTGASVQVQNDLQKAVLDFEEILQRSSSRQNNISPAAHLYSFHSDAESPDIGGSIIKPNHLSLSDIYEVDPRTIHDEDEDYRLSPGSASEMAPLGGGPPDDTASVTSNTSAGALQTIREQMAVSLERMKDLEEQVKAIPVLQVQLSVLKEEKRQLLMQLKSAEDFSKPKLYSNKNKTASIVGSRDVGVITCSVVTRDVGITHSQPKVRSVSTQANATNILAPPETKIEMNSASTETDLSMPNVYSEKELDQNIAKAIKMYEQTFYHLLHPKKKEKPVVDTIGTQTCPVDSDMLRIIERRDIAVQTASDNNYKDVGVTAKSRTADVGINAVVRTRHFGCSDNTIDRLPCDKCSVKKISVGVGTLTSDNDINNDRIPVSLNSLSVIRSKSFDYTEKPFGFMKKKYGMRSVGCSTIAKMTSSKYTSTNDHNDFNHKDVGVNTMKRKLVDAAVGDSVRLSDDNIKICDKCGVAIKTAAKDILHLHSPTKVEHGVTISRIPRPTTTPVGAVSLSTVPTSPDKRKFKRQDTYTKIYANDTSVEFNDSTGEKIDMFTLKTSSSSEEEGAGSKQTDAITNDYAQEEHVSVSEAALFQPIRNEPRQKAEPNKEMRAALKVLNDSLQKSPVGGSLPHHLMKNANDIVQQDWFKISSTASANPLDVEDYLDCFEEISSQLLEYIVNMTDISGNTAMHYALSHGNFDVVSILLDSKVCNINHANAAGYTCVMLVSLAHVTCETHRQVVRRLFQMADVNIRAKQHGQTALMLAVSHGRLETVQLLLECGADVNIQDDDGSTALMCAAEHGHIEIVKLLFSQPDCDLTITDYDGSTALNIAMEAGYRDIGLLLYAQEHFSRGNSPYPSLKQRRAKSVTPTPTSASHNSLKGLPKHQHQDNSF